MSESVSELIKITRVLLFETNTDKIGRFRPGQLIFPYPGVDYFDSEGNPVRIEDYGERAETIEEIERRLGIKTDDEDAHIERMKCLLAEGLRKRELNPPKYNLRQEDVDRKFDHDEELQDFLYRAMMKEQYRHMRALYHTSSAAFYWKAWVY